MVQKHQPNMKRVLLLCWLLFLSFSSSSLFCFSLSSSSWGVPPPKSPATGLTNRFYVWKYGQKIRYQCSGPKTGEPLLLVHGLFVNSDHWRKFLVDLNRNCGGDTQYRVYALDLLGYGYSDKPNRNGNEATSTSAWSLLNGENGRFTDWNNRNNESPSVLRNVKLGTSNGGERVRDVDLRHPLGSPYNFFTWSQLLSDFSRDVILASTEEDERRRSNTNEQNAEGGGAQRQVTLVCNSIGTSSAFQAVLDEPDLYTGVFAISPNFRELHEAEVSFAPLAMPVIRRIQWGLRRYGRSLFDLLAVPSKVKQILKVPYAVQSAVDDTLVQVLLDPLLTPNASHVLFDTLSYSAGPLPEQQLQSFPLDKPVWVCYGKEDPWTSAMRVEGLKRFSPAVERIVGFEGVGHCPHDEAPELIYPLLQEFMINLRGRNQALSKQSHRIKPLSDTA